MSLPSVTAHATLLDRRTKALPSGARLLHSLRSLLPHAGNSERSLSLSFSLSLPLSLSLSLSLCSLLSLTLTGFHHTLSVLAGFDSDAVTRRRHPSSVCRSGSRARPRGPGQRGRSLRDHYRSAPRCTGSTGVGLETACQRPGARSAPASRQPDTFTAVRHCFGPVGAGWAPPPAATHCGHRSAAVSAGAAPEADGPDTCGRLNRCPIPATWPDNSGKTAAPPGLNRSGRGEPIGKTGNGCRNGNTRGRGAREEASRIAPTEQIIQNRGRTVTHAIRHPT